MMLEILVAALSWSGVLQSDCKPTDGMQVALIGVASDPQNGSTLYCEWHTPLDDGKNKVVYYADTTGEIFAEKTLKFENDLSRPSYEQLDMRLGESHRVTQEDGTFLFEYQKATGAEIKRITIASNDVDVIDAGFDQKIRVLWDQVSKKNSEKVLFGSTVFQRTLPLRIREADTDKCPLQSHYDNQNINTRCFVIEPTSFFIRIFFDGLKLSYDANTRQLLQFFGPVNIKKPDGDKLEALIRYVYRPERS